MEDGLTLRKTLILPLLYLSVLLSAQSDTKLMFQELEEEELRNLDALAMYPEEIRTAILQVCLYPELLIKSKKLKQRTTQHFGQLLEEYPQETKQAVWDLTRYPNLVSRLTKSGLPSAEGLKLILSDYPESIHERVRTVVGNRYDLLKSVGDLMAENEIIINQLSSNYDAETRASIEQLLEYPEILSILTENIEVSILVGDAYRNHPQWVRQQADSLHLELARQNVQEMAEWKARVEENPELAEELEASAKEFAREHNTDDLYYDDEEYDYPDDDLYYEDNVRVVEQHYHYHYPYWFGYPSWYLVPRWRPYPYYYDWGFQLRPGRGIVIIGFPSVFYMDWYMWHPYHHHRYPHLSAHFVHHYYGHRRSRGSITSTVQGWHRRNRAVITEDMIANAPKRVDAYREFGKMEEARVRYNKSNPGSKLDQSNFCMRNDQKYPSLRKNVEVNEKLGKTSPQFKDTERTPMTRNPDRSYKTDKGNLNKEFIDKKRQETTDRNPNVVPRPTIPKKKYQSEKRPRRSTRKASEAHKRTWERSKSTRRTKPMPSKKVAPRQKSGKTRTKRKSQ